MRNLCNLYLLLVGAANVVASPKRQRLLKSLLSILEKSLSMMFKFDGRNSGSSLYLGPYLMCIVKDIASLAIDFSKKIVEDGIVAKYGDDL